MAMYTLTVKIDERILQMQSRDNLNIARKVNGTYTTSFHGAAVYPMGNTRPLLQVNQFQWTEEYSAFLAQDFHPGMQVTTTTQYQQIKPGQQTTFKGYMLSPAAPASDLPENTFVIRGVSSGLKAGVSCRTAGNYSPIFVDNQHGDGDKRVQLQNKFALFWDSQTGPGQMIDGGRIRNPYEFSFPEGKNEMTIRFGFQTPNQPGGGDGPWWYPEEGW